ncbi:LysR family transcriptional regulator [Phaeobacter sp.]|uniref:LysR family transcriptional regulator n=1 Tax=Phaeobacter sp. TaxID=1902409 RepID=UPI0025D474D8|nr:LysR family transcriptional regulator [Phaeobacter sp.]
MPQETDSFLLPVMNALAAFRAVASLGSVSAAAQALGTSQSSLSRHVQNLEDHLNCSLFLRQNRRMVLTAAGQQLFATVDAGLGAISQKAQELQRQGGLSEVRIRCGHGFAHFRMLPYYPRLQRSFPQLQINLSVGPLGIRPDDGVPDLDIRLGPHPDPDWHSDLLIPEDICLAAAPSFLRKHGLVDPKPEELAQLPLLHLDRDEYGILWFGSFFDRFGIDYEPDPATLFFNSYPHVVHAAIEGRGIGIIWRGLDDGALDSGDLVELPGTALKTDNGYFLTCRKATREEPDISQIRRWMINACNLAHHALPPPMS